MDENPDIWDSLAEQFQIEQDGVYPTHHDLYFVATVVNVDNVYKAHDHATQYLIMDDPDVRRDRFPSIVHGSKQIML